MANLTSLTISRKIKQRFFIGDNVVVEVVEVRGGVVRLKITAPQDVVIMREELRHRNQVKQPDEV